MAESREFVAWLESLCAESDEASRLKVLSLRLDRLCALGWSIEDSHASDAFGAHLSDRVERYRLLRDAIDTALPTLGLSLLDRIPNRNAWGENPIVSDAVDDLADIWACMDDVTRISILRSEQEAAEHFCWSFRTHWGRHARDLQSYVHWVLSEGG